MSGTELAIVLVLALLLLGPAKLPELARTMGKAVRDFKRATNDIRGSVESEFYRMDQPEPPPPAKEPLPAVARPEGSVPVGGEALPAPAAEAPVQVAEVAMRASSPQDEPVPPVAEAPVQVQVAEVAMRASSTSEGPAAPASEPPAPAGAKS